MPESLPAKRNACTSALKTHCRLGMQPRANDPSTVVVRAGVCLLTAVEC
jgi:hypothetical protein